MIQYLLIALALAAGASQAAAPARPQQQQPAPRTYTQEQLWTRADDRIAFTLARISLTQRAGSVSFHSTSEFSNQGRGMDNAIQYRSADEQVYATVYLYYPPVAHAGLTAFTTEQGLEMLSQGRLRRLTAGAVPVDGVAGAAVRIDYRNYRGNLASSAAFVKAGRWMIKIRVSGPEERRAEVDAAMTALLGSIRFEGENRPRAAATLLDVAGCASSPGNAASALPDGEQTIADALIATFDPLGETARPENGPPGGANPTLFTRIGNGWCLSTRARIGEQVVPILRATEPGGGPRGTSRVDARTVALTLISDSGTLAEVVQSEANRFTIFYHRIGETLILASYASMPNDEQLVALISGADRDAGRIRARIGHKPEGGTDIELPMPARPTGRPTT